MQEAKLIAQFLAFVGEMWPRELVKNELLNISYVEVVGWLFE